MQTIAEALDHDRTGRAIVGAERAFDYRTYRQRAHQMQALLQAEEIGSDDHVGLHFEKSPEYLIALTGVWFAGGVAVPLKRGLPEQRLDFMADDADLDATISRISEAPGPRVIDYDRLGRHKPAPAPVRQSENSAAYIVYTSGTTGKPKGVRIPHHNIIPTLREQIDHFNIGPDDNVTLYLSIDFDASLSDIGTALLSGATLHLVPDAARNDPRRLRGFLSERNITVADLPPALLGALDPQKAPESLRTVIAGGEAYDPAALREWARNVRLFNVYGPTEATICTSLNRVDPEAWDRPYIGEPIAGTTYTVDDNGELLIGGPGLAVDYYGRPEQTDEAFVLRDGHRFFRTGDRVSHHDGRLAFEGRIDRQFQLHGHRIQPEEIEQVLAKQPAIQRAACVRHERGLVAFIEADDHQGDEWSEALGEALPEWMVPDRFVVTGLPETESGKVDYDALRATTFKTDETHAKPANETEAMLVEVFEAVLGRSVGRETDFFDAGGDSLNVVQLILEAEQRGLNIAPETVEAHATPAGIADALDGGEVSPFSTSERSVDELLDDAEVGESLSFRLTEHSPGRNDHYLLTGATGQLGRFVLRSLLEQTEATVDVLVRAENDDHAQQRLDSALRTLPDGIDAVDHERLRALTGDLTEDRLGCSEYDTIAQRVDAIINVAGRVNLVKPYSALRPVNVEGVRRLVRLASLNGARLHHISTLSVFVGTDNNTGVVSEDDPITDARNVYGGYAQSKFAADCLVQKAMEAGLRGSIIRPGLIFGDRRTGVVRDDDLLGLFLRGLRSIGAVPERRDPELELDFTPVNDAAAMIAELANQQEGGIFHYANETSVSLEQLLRILRSAGEPIDEVDPARWRERARGAGVETAFARYALQQCLPDRDQGAYRGLDLFEATDITFDMGRVRDTLGAEWLAPEPTDELLGQYVVES